MKAKVTDRKFQLNINQEEFKVILASLELLDRKLETIDQPQFELLVDVTNTTWPNPSKDKESIRVSKQVSKETNQILTQLWKKN